LPIRKAPIEHLDVFTRLTLKERDLGTRIGCDHRSIFRSAEVREKRTLPRGPRSFAYVCDAATSCNPVRTVLVILAPLAR